MTTDMKLRVQNGVDDKGKKYKYVEPTDEQIDAIAEKAAGKAEDSAKKAILSTLGVKSLDLTEVVPALRKKLRDPEIDNIEGKAPVAPEYKTIHQGKTELKTHRYTIDVPDEGEHAVLNLGHGDPKRDLNDAGISARTFSHIHLHTQNAAHASMVALGGPTRAAHKEISDPRDALGQNTGITAVTNGHLWAESKAVANVASQTEQAILRAHKKTVRIQSDAADVEIGAAHEVVLGGTKSVRIVSSSDLDRGENKYGAGFQGELAKSSGMVAGKDLVTVHDAITASVAAIKGFKDKDFFYEKGKLSQVQKPNDKHKLAVDAVKALSSIARFFAGKAVGGQVKVAADTFASITGMVGASMYGHLSASVSSLLSASVVGGTASLKGLQWASVWGQNGVSVRTVKGSASLRSEEGKVTLSAKDEIGVSSRKGVNIGGDDYAELKSGGGYCYVGAHAQTLLCAGQEDGMGVVAKASSLYVGDVTDAGTSGAKAKNGCFIAVAPPRKTIFIKAPASGIKLAEREVTVIGKKAHIL